MRVHINWRSVNWRSVVKVLAVVAAAAMFLVYIMGTVVTNTNSGQGCGRTWPLCRGKFIPEFAVSTAIEFSHRAATGIEGLLIVGLAIGAFIFWRQRREIQVLVPLMIAFLLIEAVLGAIVAVQPRQALVLAIHFGSSLILLISVVLTAVVIGEASGADAVRDRPLSRRFTWAVAGGLGLTYVVGYLGAYAGHMGIGLACPDWPLCRGTVIPALTGATGAARGLMLLHRYSALLLLLATGALAVWARRLRRGRPDLYRSALLALGLLALQALAGAYLVYSHLSLFSRLIHAGLVALYFTTLCYLLLHALPRPVAFRAKIVRHGVAPARAVPAVDKPSHATR
jgi:cytochrome c oxidase assembly protein subunit 15